MSSERVVIVTGAGGGIGRATAELFLEHGYGVIAADISRDSLAWADEVDLVHAVVTDVSEESSNLELAQAAMSRFGRVDACVLNAGIAKRTDWEGVDAVDLYDRIMAVNARSIVLGIRSVAPLMAAQGSGSIVVVASTSGVRADPQRWAYNASKAAAVNLARAAALDWASRGVRVNVLAPGPTHTSLIQGGAMTADHYADLVRPIPLQRLGRPQEQAAAIYFLASDAASFITGAVLMCDGGITANVGIFRPTQSADLPE